MLEAFPSKYELIFAQFATREGMEKEGGKGVGEGKKKLEKDKRKLEDKKTLGDQDDEDDREDVGYSRGRRRGGG